MTITASLMGIPLLSQAQTSAGGGLCWSVCAGLPPAVEGHPNPGVAGPFAGVSGDVLLIAGGANFPNGKPWEGRKKAYTDDVYIMKKGPEGSYSCRRAEHFRLPEKIAYGASVTTPAGVLCIGGETASGYSDKVFLLSWNAGEQAGSIRQLPPLPQALANAGAVAIGSRIYVVGGENEVRALAGIYCLDLDAASLVWESLPPLPIAVSHTVAVTLSGEARPGVYVIGGRSKTDSGISDLHSTVFRFDVSGRSWSRLADIRDGRGVINLSAANAVAFDGRILVIGGDRGDIFRRIEVYNARIAAAKSDSVRTRYSREKLRLLLDHPGFSNAVLEYDVQTTAWREIGTLPGDAPVTTTAVLWEGDVFIPCGEIRPGVRTTAIWKGIICNK